MTTQVLLVLASASALAACASAAPPATQAPPAPPPTASAPVVVAPPGAAARADSLRQSYTQADVDFMTGMIHHHAQALVMARWAQSHGANAALQIMAARIINAQYDEIRIMQSWLRERGQPVPDPESTHAAHQPMHMPGMLTSGQLESLDAARDAEFDRLFLTYMIQHHQGALTMVSELFGTHGAAQGDAIFKVASDIAADQASEIDRMQMMLREHVFEADAP